MSTLELQQAVIFHNKKDITPVTHYFPTNVYQGSNNLVIHHEFNEFPNIIQYDDVNPTIFTILYD